MHTRSCAHACFVLFISLLFIRFSVRSFTHLLGWFCSSACLSVCLDLFVCLSVCWSVRLILIVRWFVDLSVYLSVGLKISLFICPLVFRSVCSSARWFVDHLFICPLVCRSVCLSVRWFVVIFLFKFRIPSN